MKKLIPPVKYCTKCGSDLFWERYIANYNHNTGEPRYHYHYWCSKSRFWNTHSDWKCDEYGSTYGLND